MTDSTLVCFCTEKSQADVKDFIKAAMKPSDEVNNDLLYKVHKSFANEALIGRCCGCMDEVEEMMIDYKQGKWS